MTATLLRPAAGLRLIVADADCWAAVVPDGPLVHLVGPSRVLVESLREHEGRPHERGALLDSVLARFDELPASAREDLGAVLDELVDLGLVEAGPDTTPGSAVGATDPKSDPGGRHER